MSEQPDQNCTSALVTWEYHGLPDYAPIGLSLPVIENSLTQIAAGPLVCGGQFVSNGEVFAGRALVDAHAVGRTELRQDSIGCYVPLRWSGDLTFNGAEVSPGSIQFPVEDVSFHIRGRTRDLAGCLVPRNRFVETLAALRGDQPDRLKLHQGALELAPGAADRVRAGLLAIIRQGFEADARSAAGHRPLDLSSAVFELMLEAYLHGRPEQTPKSGRVRDAARIVRAAEEHFVAAGAKLVSLADLCRAAGVSKNALYLAFKSYCGETPVAYFHKRRLAKARSRLITAEPARGAVKRIALDVGLTELGRFSTQYRELFGESPSVTLYRSAIPPDVAGSADC